MLTSQTFRKQFLYLVAKTGQISGLKSKKKNFPPKVQMPITSMFLGVKVPNLQCVLTMSHCTSVPNFKSILQNKIFQPKFQMPITPTFTVVKVPKLDGVFPMSQCTYVPNFKSKLQKKIFPPKFQRPITPTFTGVKVSNLHGELIPQR